MNFWFHNYVCYRLLYMLRLWVKWLSVDTVGEGRSILSIFLLQKWFIFPLDLFYFMCKVKTGNPGSDKAQVIENVTLKY